jgi:radical SAM protein with 4Fe4S-binding SPASM domain
LSRDEIRDILTVGRALGLRKVGLTGGEPLIDVPKLADVGRFCLEELHVPVHMHTNGTLVEEHMCRERGVLTLFEAVSVTFLGGDADTHEYMTRTKGSFTGAFRGAGIIARAGLPLTCYYIPTHGTCTTFRELTPRLYDVGVRRVRAMALAPSGRARPIYGETAPTQEEMKRFEIDLLEARDRLGIHVEAGYCTRLSMPNLAVLAGHDVCMSGRNRVHINSKGDVFPCTAASGVKELRLGNVKEDPAALRKIWVESDIINIIRRIHNGGLPACAACNRNPKCRDGCTVNACGTMSDEGRAACPLTNAQLRSQPR